jgi:hypothetical protein
VIAIAGSAAACSQTMMESPAGPTPPPGAPAADISGRWVGTWQSANFAPRSIAMNIGQVGGCVDGTWATTIPEWSGIISGTATLDSFTSLISFEDTTRGSRCSATATLTGGVGGNSMTWRVDPLSVVACPGEVPRDVVITLSRPEAPAAPVRGRRRVGFRGLPRLPGLGLRSR